MMRIVLLGAPGSGKGTQAQRLQAKYGVPQVSSGDLLRDAVARGTDLGRKAKAVMESGQLVSDEIVLGLIRDRLSRPDAAKGFILDGFPRNIDQANSLNALLTELSQPLDAVLLLDVRKETLMQRLAGRRVCPKCGAVYNVHTMPAGTTTCANDGTELYQRPDDKEEVIGKRLEVYERQTRPLIEHYSRLGLLRAIAGEGDLDDVFERMEAAALARPVPAEKVKLERPSTAAQKKNTAQRVAKSRGKQRARTALKSAAQAATKRAGKPAAKAATSKAKSQTATIKAQAKSKSAKRVAGRKTPAKKTSKAKSQATGRSKSSRPRNAKRKTTPRAKK